MIYQEHLTLPTQLLEQVAEQSLEYLPELIRIVINTNDTITPSLQRLDTTTRLTSAGYFGRWKKIT